MAATMVRGGCATRSRPSEDVDERYDTAPGGVVTE
jgi:hypothetical protein